MATPVYNTHWAGGGHWGYPARRTWGVIERLGSWFGGGTPQYCGSGQPTPYSGSSILGSGTPVYMPAPPMTVTADATTAPQASSLAIVVPRS